MMLGRWSAVELLPAPLSAVELLQVPLSVEAALASAEAALASAEAALASAEAAVPELAEAAFASVVALTLDQILQQHIKL